jgi:uncharacterized membrane protein YfcA
MSLPIALAIYLATGCAAGYLAGLFGVGGGIIIVPVLNFLFERLGFPPELHARLAVGTSMAIVTVTAIFSARTHDRNGNVDWPRVRSLLPVVVLGVLAGALVGASVSRRVLVLSVLTFEIGVAGLFIYETTLGSNATRTTPEPSRRQRSGVAVIGLGTLLAAVSSIVGIAGGTLFVPFLNLGGMGMRRAIGTAAALGVPIGLVAAEVYLITGLAAGTSLPAHCAGYIYLPAFIGCSLGGTFTSRHGANLGKKLNVRGLKLAFALVLLAAATRMALGLRAHG